MEEYRYSEYDYGGWGLGGKYNNKMGCNYEEDWHFQQVEFYRPDGDVEGKDIGWCLSNGFFMIRPGLWSGPWYFEDFPEARKENCSEEDLEIVQQEPAVQRVVENGTNKSLKMSIGIKKLHSSEMNSEMKDMARTICNAFVINGVQYCRAHLMICCHLCEVNYDSLRDEVNDERARLLLRPGGAPSINEMADKWQECISEQLLLLQLETDDLRSQYGGDTDHPEYLAKWHEYMKAKKFDEREINNRFLSENNEFLKNKGANQCCYWACKTPNGREEQEFQLRKCTGCGIVKYCCKEHQKLDWKWEHRGECTSNIPEFVQKEITMDRIKNLVGDYSENTGSLRQKLEEEEDYSDLPPLVDRDTGS
ncbi:hypothetical protein CTEN210_17565 [Chaetoceros tenuissimus]|uniref:MYND-type domain-containing protein n=1 Tax=Chaetoceros tenuissimus TaxID=426638 RepID=A0AAD3DAY9_9STRA|nr:hypothetical protein CTEN210_17565 [Chaetoceros tenuissimus]